MATLYKVVGDKYEMKDGGAMVDALQWDKDGKNPTVIGHKPIVGCSLMVGTYFTRTYGNDYWLTTEVTEILEETEKEVKFKTLNSTYVLVW